MSSPILSAQYYTMRPTRLTRFMRTFPPWQLVRFIIINLRMIVMIVKSHGGAIPAKTEKDP